MDAWNVGNRKALLIGINYYESEERGEDTWPRLDGCLYDVKKMKSALKDIGFQVDSNHMQILTDKKNNPEEKQPTRENIIEKMKWLVEGAEKEDSLFLHYAGHGGYKKDKEVDDDDDDHDDDGDEVDGYDETIVPADWYEYDGQSGEITDDYMNEILVQPLPEDVRLTVIFDCCHSGTALDLPYVYNTITGSLQHQRPGKRDLEKAWRDLDLGRDDPYLKLSPEAKQKALDKTREKASEANVVMFSACKDFQTATDRTQHNTSNLFLYALKYYLDEGSIPSTLDLVFKMQESFDEAYDEFQEFQVSTGKKSSIKRPFII